MFDGPWWAECFPQWKGATNGIPTVADQRTMAHVIEESEEEPTER